MLAIRAAILVTALALGACLGPAASGGSPELVPRALSEDPPARLGQAEVLGVVELSSSVSGFGGISGMSFDGTQVTAVTDRGRWLRFRMEVDKDGRPVAAGGLEIHALGGVGGGKAEIDAEELVRTPDGWLVGFERRHRVLAYPGDLSSVPEALALPQGFTRQPTNGGAEAMARLPDGRLLLLSEEGINPDDTGWAWIGRPGAWEGARYALTGSFRPTGAAALPDGDVVVTERRFSLLGGVALRLVRVPAAALKAGALLEGREVFRLEPPLLVDNFESIAVHRRADGRLVAYILSDDNFAPIQATLLLAVLLPDQ